MKCPICGKTDTRVLDTRASEENSTIRRRRFCDSCKKRFTTYERIESVPLLVHKRNGTLQQYDRQKIQNGIIRSLTKRPFTIQQIEKLVDEIENTILSSLEKEISSDFIGGIVMEKLKNTDDVAYVRFASVYREFKDISTFMEELQKLLLEKSEKE